MAPPPVDPTAPAPSPASKPTKGKKPRKEYKAYKPTGRGKGRRSDIAWDTIEGLYVRGEMVPNAAGNPEHLFPTIEQLAARFQVDPASIHKHSRKGEWPGQREEFRRKLREEIDRKSADFIAKAGDLWSPQVEKAFAVAALGIEECRYALDFHRSGAATLAAASTARAGARGRNRPGGGDSDAQGDGDGGAPADPSKPVTPRLPMPARDLKDTAAALKTNLDTLRGLIFGQQPPATAPTSTGTAAGGEAAPAPIDPRAAEVLVAFLGAAADRNKAPPTDGK